MCSAVMPLLMMRSMAPVAAEPVIGPILYVEDDAPGPLHDGSDWNNAYVSLQQALGAAFFSNGMVTEIRVAQGVYTPVPADGDRRATFELIDGVETRGGYAGVGAADPNDRDADAYETILSGDLNRDDAKVGTGENCYHVLTTSANDATAILDGFTITGGNADGDTPLHDRGGGMFNVDGIPSIRNCVFRANAAVDRGSGIYVGSGNPKLTHCAIVASTGSEGMYISGGASLMDCTFRDNPEGGLSVRYGSPRLVSCTFHGDEAVSVFRGGSALVNCVFSGAGLTLTESAVTLTNCTLHATEIHSELSMPRIVNCIVWGTSITGVTPIVDYSCIEDPLLAAAGVGNTNDDPRFTDANGFDGIIGTLDDDLRLRSGSPCIDAGDSDAIDLEVTSDRDGAQRFVDDPTEEDTGVGPAPAVDMGAYEYQADCNDNGIIDSMDITDATSLDCNINGIPDACDGMDIDGDADIDLDDYDAFTACATGPCAQPPCVPPLFSDLCCAIADSDSDGDVDVREFGVFQAAFDRE